MKTKNSWVEPAIATCAVVLLLALSYQILAPFIAALVWAGILVYASWKPYSLLSKWMRGNRLLPALLLVGTFALVVVVPLVIAGVELAGNIDGISHWLQSHIEAGLPPLPHFLTSLPWFGPKVSEFWNALAQGDPEVVNRLKEWLKPIGSVLLLFGKAIGSGLMLMLMSLAFAFFFYVGGHEIVRWFIRVLNKIGGKRAEELLMIAAGTVRGVVYGFIGTALVQGALAWFGYWLVGVENAAAFGLVSCFLSLIPGGPSLLGLPVAFWLYQQGDTGWAVFLGIWMVAVVSMADNVVKPLFIGKESNLPFVLILVGVLGGALAWGVLGVFLGPTLLAVSYALLHNWAARQIEEEAEQDAKANDTAS
ncbi:AI-2E family transporter [Jeongeupia naejangsanensis]|uniref:AI-2E family transporter n=1 Tax=Jeongeupia naejangsanensis TaxID=613195 RepID=A0ABS2BN58_9NEIS|nr:AI-2E family transporter [Jeongeupia naejangsanensis]MBM3117062.1 AI-2E family transporter [Jeongeupia naejangsanensis]